MARDIVLNQFANVLRAKTADLAAAQTSQEVTALIDDAKKETESVAPAFVADTWIYRMTVAFLGLAMLSVIFSYIVYAPGNREMPGGLVAIGSAAIGALAGLLAPAPAR